MLLNQRRLYENYYETNNWPSYVGLFPLFFFHWTIKSKKHCETLGNTTLLSSYRRKKKKIKPLRQFPYIITKANWFLRNDFFK